MIFILKYHYESINYCMNYYNLDDIHINYNNYHYLSELSLFFQLNVSNIENHPSQIKNKSCIHHGEVADFFNI